MTFPTKEAAFDALENARADWLASARTIAFRLGVSGDPVTVDDVRRHCPPPDGVDPRVMGAVFQKAHWDNVGPIKSKRRTCHKRPICQFVLKGVV